MELKKIFEPQIEHQVSNFYQHWILTDFTTILHSCSTFSKNRNKRYLRKVVI